ncbi:hypothetical protein KEM60_00268 [Austwickia sp. TVS 96-490-7B]|uniref:alpha/beta hydrolase n=1 Tax=Austwickia sp. TVS 96-490-7B TaxID=2830843 RepID=UPI001C59ACCD|nr:alpha/beta hydrolase-fold protein [Austwickia sp. TVS 96-490-7B]MBW3084085.1 hypothetical protein [Austwickia sp. TVS 96-490-7B]
MELTGIPFTATTVVVAVTAFVAAALWLPRLTGSWVKVLSRVLSLAMVNVMVVVAVAAYMNSQNGWYSSWGDLLGSEGRSQTDQKGNSAAKAAEASVSGERKETKAPTTFPALPNPGERIQTYLDYTGPESKVTGEIQVILPRSYEDPSAHDKTYPVVEAFHGFPANPTGWTKSMNAQQYFDAAVDEGRIREAIIVVPQVTVPARYDSECVNGTKDKPQIETWISKDIPDFIRSHFRVDQARASWAAMGYSMGGYCAQLMGTYHSETFGAVVSLGGYPKPDFVSDIHPWPAGSPLAERYNLVNALRKQMPPVAMYIQVGKQSPYWPQIKQYLDEVKAPASLHSVILLDNGHRFELWKAEMPKVLTWLGESIPGFAAR